MSSRFFYKLSPRCAGVFLEFADHQLQNAFYVSLMRCRGLKEVYSGIQGKSNREKSVGSVCGESQARTRYTFFASVAKKEGYEQISSIFQETADNEKEHAELFWSNFLRCINANEFLEPIVLNKLEYVQKLIRNHYP